MKSVLVFFCFSVFQIYSINAHAEEIYPYTAAGKFHELYDQMFQKDGLIEGDVIVFHDGSRYQYSEYLGSGLTSHVYKVRPIVNRKVQNKFVALRIPIANKNIGFIGFDLMGFDIIKFRTHADQYVDKTVKGYKALAGNTHIPKILNSSPGKYIEIEYIKTDFNYSEFFIEYNNEFYNKYRFPDPQLIHDAKKALIEFAKSFALFRQIGDFSPDQLRYSIAEKKWFLLDWTDRHKKVFNRIPIKYQTIFDGDFEKALKKDTWRATNSLETTMFLNKLKEITYQTRDKIREQNSMKNQCYILINSFRTGDPAR